MHAEPFVAPQGSTEMLESEYHRMAQVEAALWWYRSLHADLLDTIRKHFGSDTHVRIVDAGCGTGGFLEHLRRNGYANCSGLDISTLAVDFCRKRGLDVRQGSISDAEALAAMGKADVIVSMDVICSLPDSGQRSAFLRAAYAQLNPGGLLVVQTPAFECLGGIHDLAVGVNKRYTKRELRALLRAAGIGSYTLRYRLMLLTPLVFIARAWQRMRLKSGGDVKIESDVSLPPRAVNSLLYGLQRFEDRFVPLRPFGTSLQILVKKEQVS